MKVLFMAAGTSPASVFAIAPLATAVRNAGHEIIVAGFGEMTPTIESVGLPPVAVVPNETADNIHSMDRPGGKLEFPPSPANELPFLGSWFGRQAAVSLEGLLELSRRWRPDIVVGGTLDYSTSLLSAHLGVPHVRQAWDWLDLSAAHSYADAELQPELAAVGLERLPAPGLLIDICPPSLRPADAGPAHMMRWIPGNRQRQLEPWMYTRGRRTRVCVTLGSMRGAVRQTLDYLCHFIEYLLPLDVDLVVAANESIAAELRSRYPDIHADWVPMDILTPTCDLIIHHNGGLTGMTAMNAGKPQVILNSWNMLRKSLSYLEEQGSGIVLDRGEDTPGNVAEACKQIISDATYTQRARVLSEEIAALDTPATLVGALEELVAENH
ncbi:nucleotide disphospho-sugar-binding domain-containing protein [Streptomyces platensis]|uniref:nucleotide disphospho-sugar-binding domain-containing protein n=1 Tax=Streptomyces platensis TaxID=58346 RepID=UPI00378BA24E